MDNVLDFTITTSNGQTSSLAEIRKVVEASQSAIDAAFGGGLYPPEISIQDGMLEIIKALIDALEVELTKPANAG